MNSQKKAWQTMKNSPPAKKAHYTRHRKVGALRAWITRLKNKVKFLQDQQ